MGDPAVLEKARVRCSVLDVIEGPEARHENPTEMGRTAGAKLNKGRTQRGWPLRMRSTYFWCRLMITQRSPERSRYGSHT